MHRILIQLIMKYFYCLIKNCSLGDFLASGPAMLVTPVPIKTLKLSNIGPGEYMDGRPRGTSVANCMDSFINAAYRQVDSV